MFPDTVPNIGFGAVFAVLCSEHVRARLLIYTPVLAGQRAHAWVAGRAVPLEQEIRRFFFLNAAQGCGGTGADLLRLSGQ